MAPAFGTESLITALTALFAGVAMLFFGLARVRQQVATLADDRPPSPDIAAIARMIGDGSLEAAAAVEVK